jgi:polyisoprenoid-binding protein YceI
MSMTTATDTMPAGTIGLPLDDGIYQVDSERSAIEFAVKQMWGLATVRGRFRSYAGTLLVRAGDAAGDLRIEAGSLHTGNDRRDQHLRSPDFFDAERHPRIVFATTGVIARDGGLAIAGELAIGAARAPIDIPMTLERVTDGAVRLQGTAAVSREATGLAWNKLGVIRGDAMLHVRLTLERAAGAGPIQG